MNGKAEWTFMVYIAADNNLSKYVEDDLEQMQTVGSTDKVNVLVEIDYGDDRSTKRYHVRCNELVEEKDEDGLGETNSGDPKTYTDFVSSVAKNFPAERYALILWSHGTGWEPRQWDRVPRIVGSRDSNSRSNALIRYIAPDDTTKDALNTVELGNVLRDVKKIIGKDLDLLGMDACLMSNFEVAYQVKDHVKYVVGSETAEPKAGWPYDAVLRKLVESPDIKSSQFAAYIVNAYIKDYLDRKFDGLVTQSALDLSRTEQVVKPLDELARALIACMKEGFREIDAALGESIYFHLHKKTLLDIAHFCKELKKVTRDDAVKKAAEDVCLALKPGLNNFVIAASDNLAKDARYCGVTIYMVPRGNSFSQGYSLLEYAKKNWSKMLMEYHDVIG